MKKLSTMILAASMMFASSVSMAQNYFDKMYVKPSAALTVFTDYKISGHEEHTSFDLTTGLEHNDYSYELGYTQSIPKKDSDSFDSFRYKASADFYNVHFDVNKKFALNNKLKAMAGVGLGYLSLREDVNVYAYGQKVHSTYSDQFVQPRINTGLNYEVAKNFNTGLNLSAQASSKTKPVMFGTNLNVRYDF